MQTMRTVVEAEGLEDADVRCEHRRNLIGDTIGSVAERWRRAVINADWRIDAMAGDLKN